MGASKAAATIRVAGMTYTAEQRPINRQRLLDFQNPRCFSRMTFRRMSSRWLVTRFNAGAGAPLPDLDEPHPRSSRTPLKNGWRSLPSADFARYSTSASNCGSTQMPLWAIFLV